MKLEIDWKGVRREERLSETLERRLCLTMARLIKKAKDKTFAVSFVSETRMASLNGSYRGQKKSTDVLSFGPSERSEFPKEDPSYGGDIVLCLPYLARQAKRERVPLKEELVRMLSHGVLHCSGFDHEKDAEAKRMYRLQEEIVDKTTGIDPV